MEVSKPNFYSASKLAKEIKEKYVNMSEIILFICKEDIKEGKYGKYVKPLCQCIDVDIEIISSKDIKYFFNLSQPILDSINVCKKQLILKNCW